MNKPIQPLTAVVVGTGFIGPVHVEALQRAGVYVAGIVGSTPEKSAQATASLGLPRVYATLEEALADSSVDVIHLATPNRLHYEQTKAVLLAGKHVLCEKPLAMDSQQSSELVQLAETSGCAAGVAYNIRFYPLCHEACSRIAAGEIGDILHVTGSYTQDWLLHRSDFNWRVVAEDGGELRAVADIGTHWLDLVQFVTGRTVTSVMADLQTVHPSRDRPVGGALTFSGANRDLAETQPVKITTEDAGNVLLRLDNGAKGLMHVSQTTAGKKNCLRLEVAGSRQSICFDSQSPNVLSIGHRDCANELLIRDPSLLHPNSRRVTSYPGGHNEGFPDTFKQLFRAFYGYIQAGDMNAPSPFPTFADGHREILLCEAILRSHREQTWISIVEPTG